MQNAVHQTPRERIRDEFRNTHACELRQEMQQMINIVGFRGKPYKYLFDERYAQK
jgi:hypothetical protein